ncbi:MAG: hypothetical protein KatS3mg027_0201 [Bacteroidia bacterium]|nr:MAG: hypothetical protein KatS3mg027_0201 [Bacteroidia bacterium]
MNILFVICLLLLLSYLLELFNQKIRLPSVIFLIASGLALKESVIIFYPEFYQAYNIVSLLPIIGTVGLILIVLEGAIELEISRNKLSIVSNATLISFLSIIANVFIITLLLKIFWNIETDWNFLLLQILPFAIISSAIAIPAVRFMDKTVKEFVIYESSLSDIFGVIVFNFLLVNETINWANSFYFIYQILLMLVISIIISIGLSLFLSKINHHVKFIPIIIVIILVYLISKIYHLPSLLLILVFGLTIKNFEKLSHFKFTEKIVDFFQPQILNKELKKFEDIVNESAFLVKTMFFILLGYSLDINDILNIQSLEISMLIITIIYLLRIILLWLFKVPTSPILFIAPRGLISILLFIQIPENMRHNLLNMSVIVQTVILTTITMAIGNMVYKNKNTPS